MTRRALFAAMWLVTPLIIAVRVNFDLPFAEWVARKDFVNLWVAGRLAIEGAVATIFDPGAFQAATSDMFAGSWTTNNYSYPPHALAIAMPFALLPYIWAFVVWTIAGIILISWAARRTMPAGFPWWLAALTPAGLINILWGHYGFLFGALWMLAFAAKRPAPFAALLTFKPHLGLLLVPRLGWRDIGVAAALTLALVAISAALFGIEAWRAFLTDTFAFQGSLLSPANRDKLLFLQVSPVVSYGWGGWMFFAFVAALLAARSFDVFTAATATFLIVPYGFHYDMTVVCLGFAVALTRDDLTPVTRIACTLGFLSPALILFGNFFAPPILLWGLWAQTRLGGGVDLVEQARSGLRRRNSS